MPKTISDERVALHFLTNPPTNPKKITTTEYDNGAAWECNIMDYQLGATASDTVDQSELCVATNAKVPGRSNYEGSMTVFRYLTSGGLPDTTPDAVWAAIQTKGTTLYLVEREGPVHTVAGDAGQEVSYYEVITDTPTKPSDRAGYIRRDVVLLVQKAVENTLLV